MTIVGLQGTITLYHGSIYLFDKPDAGKGKPYKDFGKGFYTTRQKEHAVNLALRNKMIAEKRNKQLSKSGSVNAFLYTYELNVNTLSDYSAKEFLKADKEWVLFVLANRASDDKSHTFDVVIGPTANDDTRASMRAYNAGLYGEQDSAEAIDMLIRRLMTDVLPEQVYFGNNNVLSLLMPKGDAIQL